MQPSSLPIDPGMPSRQSQPDNPPLVGSWLLCARLVWWAVTLLVVVLFVMALPASFALLQTMCRSCNGPQLTPTLAHQLQALGLSLPFYAAYFVTLNCAFFAMYLVVACILFWKKADDWMAWISSLFLVSFGGAAFPGTLDALVLLNPTWRLLVAIARFLGLVFLSLFSYLFPDGRFVPLWIRYVALIGLLVQVPETLFPGSPLSFSHLPRPLVVVSFFILLACPLAVQIYRYRCVSRVVQRQQTKWVIFGLTVAIVGFLSLLLLTAAVSPAGKTNAIAQLLVLSSYYIFFILIPLAIGVAILRYRLWNIDIIINRTLVYGGLSAGIIGLYMVLVLALGALFRTGGNLLISLGATGLVAVLFHPLQERLQRGVNRLLYGQRDEPYTVITQLSQRLKGTLAPEAVLSTIVETVAQALKLPYAAILWKYEETFELAASYGRLSGEAVTLPLSYQTETIGQLQLAPRAPGETFTPADVRLLDELARQAGLAAHAVRLATDLQRARERLVLAREEERRRLRRDLHDGIGPTLASLSQRIDTACHLVARDPEAAIVLLGSLKAQVKSSIGDIRRVVYALRPPVLDELGLVSAIREHAMQLHETNGLRVSIEAPPDLPLLPAAVEVAAYRITLEALTNVERHAQARHCQVCLELAGERSLLLSVVDDGRGLSENYHAGVGITSMRERVAELDGEFTLTATPDRGTRVQVQLPLRSYDTITLENKGEARTAPQVPTATNGDPDQATSTSNP